MQLRVAFVGFSHGHINSLYQLIQKQEGAQIVAACEEDPAAREVCLSKGIAITHGTYANMLAEVECDVVACGDVFGLRGQRLIAAMEAGHHVMADKPLCTRLIELQRIEALSREKHLCVGCMLPMGGSPQFRTLRRLLRQDVLGETQVIAFNGQHRLKYEKRPGWYFEREKHGGTLNDLAIHAIDAIPWLTGLSITEILAGRVWNACLKEHPQFQDGAVLMLGLENNGIVTGDVSYLAPESSTFQLPTYWRFHVTGSRGHAVTSSTAQEITIYLQNATAPQIEALDAGDSDAYWNDFVGEIIQEPNKGGLHTERILESTRIALIAQETAETGVFPRQL